MSLDGEGGPTLHRVLVCLFFGFFCILLSLLYPLCLCLLSPFFILLPLMMTFRVMSKILAKRQTTFVFICCIGTVNSIVKQASRSFMLTTCA